MTKHLRRVKVSLIMGILLISTVICLVNTASSKIIEYPSLISIEITPESIAALQEPVDIESVLIVQLKIGYSVSIPAWTESGGTLARLWLFGSMIQYPQLIHLEIEGKPDWADIALAVPDVYIQNFSTSPVYTTADLIITPYIDAPAVPKSVTIKATAGNIGRILGVVYHRTLNFEPDYIPLIRVETEKPTRQVAPREPINFEITIMNMGNKETLVNGRVLDAPDEWAALISPTQLPLGPGETATVTVSMTAPYTFGWHNEIRTFTVEFTPEKSPPSIPPITGSAQIVQLRVNSIGFSTPGFEFVLLFTALIISLIIIKKRTKK